TVISTSNSVASKVTEKINIAKLTADAQDFQAKISTTPVDIPAVASMSAVDSSTADPEGGDSVESANEVSSLEEEIGDESDPLPGCKVGLGALLSQGIRSLGTTNGRTLFLALQSKQIKIVPLSFDDIRNDVVPLITTAEPTSDDSPKTVARHLYFSGKVVVVGEPLPPSAAATRVKRKQAKAISVHSSPEPPAPAPATDQKRAMRASSKPNSAPAPPKLNSRKKRPDKTPKTPIAVPSDSDMYDDDEVEEPPTKVQKRARLESKEEGDVAAAAADNNNNYQEVDEEESKAPPVKLANDNKGCRCAKGKSKAGAAAKAPAAASCSVAPPVAPTKPVSRAPYQPLPHLVPQAPVPLLDLLLPVLPFDLHPHLLPVPLFDLYNSPPLLDLLLLVLLFDHHLLLPVSLLEDLRLPATRLTQFTDAAPARRFATSGAGPRPTVQPGPTGTAPAPTAGAATHCAPVPTGPPCPAPMANMVPRSAVPPPAHPGNHLMPINPSAPSAGAPRGAVQTHTKQAPPLRLPSRAVHSVQDPNQMDWELTTDRPRS
ncbi:hypothetical protein DXG01_002841, partial [Tephrocybe rancida]